MKPVPVRRQVVRHQFFGKFTKFNHEQICLSRKGGECELPSALQPDLTTLHEW
jgi:hypothetical protein